MSEVGYGERLRRCDVIMIEEASNVMDDENTAAPTKFNLKAQTWSFGLCISKHTLTERTTTGCEPGEGAAVTLDPSMKLSARFGPTRLFLVDLSMCVMPSLSNALSNVISTAAIRSRETIV